MGKVIVLATSKGGAGKTTLARSLACYWYNLGLKVCVIDADPQGSFSKKHNPEGPLKNMTVITQPEEIVYEDIEREKQKHDYVIVDTGGFRNRTMIRALISSDLVVIPFKPSSDDVEEALNTFKVLQELKKVPEREGRSVYYRMILTMSQHGTIIAKHVKDELKRLGYLVLDAELYNRVAYPEAGIQGLAPNITEPDGAASRDIDRIVNELAEVINDSHLNASTDTVALAR